MLGYCYFFFIELTEFLDDWSCDTKMRFLLYIDTTIRHTLSWWKEIFYSTLVYSQYPGLKLLDFCTNLVGFLLSKPITPIFISAGCSKDGFLSPSIQCNQIWIIWTSYLWYITFLVPQKRSRELNSSSSTLALMSTRVNSYLESATNDLSLLLGFIAPAVSSVCQPFFFSSATDRAIGKTKSSGSFFSHEGTKRCIVLGRSGLESNTRADKPTSGRMFYLHPSTRESENQCCGT